jgi:predicted membrane metal-binding protein
MGILLLQKPLEKWGNSVCDFVKEKCAKKSMEEQEKKPAITVQGKIRQAVIGFLATTVAAQIATAPVLLYSFGYLSVWSLLLNCIFVPFISAVFSLLLIFVMVACVLPIGASVVVLYLPNVVWSAVLLVFESVDFSALSISGVTVSVAACVCYYGGLTFVTDKWNLTKKWKNAYAMLCFAGFVGVILLSNL